MGLITKITPDGGMARLLAEPSATNYVAVEPIYQPDAVAALRNPREPLEPEPDAPQSAPPTAAEAAQ